MILETERLLLRPWTENDAEICYAYAKDPQVGPIAGWPVHTSVENIREIIKTVLMIPETYAITVKETGTLVGCIGIQMKGASELTDRDDEGEIGYWMGRPYWGQGIMPEAVKEIQRHAFEDLHFTRLWCAYYEGNEKSKRVQEKCGFRYVRTDKDVDVPLMHDVRTVQVNCLTREEWINS